MRGTKYEVFLGRWSPGRFLLLAAILTGICRNSSADDRSAAEVLPPSVVLFAEIPNPGGITQEFRGHPLVREIRNHEAWKKVTSSPDFAKAMIGVALLEFKLGMTWQKALATLTEGGVALGVDAESKGVVILSRSRDSAGLTKIVDSLVQMARDDARGKGKSDPIKTLDYRGVTVFQAQGFGFAQVDSWLAIGNESELGKEVIDRILDGNSESLATNEAFLAARREAGSGTDRGPPSAWAYLNLDVIRKRHPNHRMFSGRADDPAGEVLVGGILEVLSRAPSLLAEVRAARTELELRVSAPFERNQVGENREHYFGPQGTGGAAPVPEVPNLLLSMTTYRDLSAMWLRAGELFPERVVDKMAEAESNLTTLFSGRDFGEEVLGSVEPQIQLLVARQQYGAGGRPVPAIQLPAFALVFRLKNPETSWADLRRIFQSLIGFLNVAGAQNGNPQLDILRETVENGEIVSATFVRPTDANPRDPVTVHYNFSPTVASSGRRFILSSTRTLALDILNAPEPSAGDDQSAVNTQWRMNVSELKGILDANREHLIAQNMLEKGHGRSQAEQEVDTLVALLGLVRSADLTLAAGKERLSFKVRLDAALPGGDR